MAWPVLPHGFLGTAAVTGDEDTYQVERSLRFNSVDNTYLSRTPSVAGNRKTWTLSFWYKKSLAGSSQIFHAGTSVNDRVAFNINEANAITISTAVAGVTTNWLLSNSVLRDTAAWSHFVVAFDTTQATASNRIRAYTNGVEITSWATDNRSSISQNSDHFVNSTNIHYLLANLTPAVAGNGYIAEVHFIDGQALTPSSFGETDAITGRWKAKAVSGISYGTNGFYLNFSDNSNTTAATLGKDSAPIDGNHTAANNYTPTNFSVTAGVGNDSFVDSPTNYGALTHTFSDDTYQISRSLRFNSADSAYLSRTPSSSGNRRTFTWSGWVKRTATSPGTVGIFEAATNANNRSVLLFSANDTLQYYENSAGSVITNLITNLAFKDFSVWNHFVLSVDTTQATAANRVRMYLNGVELTSFSTSTYPTQNFDSQINLNVATVLGAGVAYTPSNYINAYISEVNFVDGQALTPDNFGVRDPNTYTWKPKAYTGTYGTNGFYLPFSNNSSTITANLLTYSEEFNDASWGKFQSTITTNATTAPNGTTTAEKLVETVTTGGHSVFKSFTATDNTDYTFSCYLKASERNIVLLNIQKKDGTSYPKAEFNLTSGTIVSFDAGVTANITSVGSGWYRCSMAVNVGTGATASPNVFVQHVTVGNGDGTSGFFLWGAQLEPTATLGQYLNTGATAITTSLRLGEDKSVSTGGYSNWVTNNLSVTAGTGNDSLVDTPTYYGTDAGAGGEARGDYCTLDPNFKVAAITLTNGNLDYSQTASSGIVLGTIQVSSGKWYWEMHQGSGRGLLGIAEVTTSVSITAVGFSAKSYGYYSNNGNKYNNSSPSAYGATFTTGDIIGVALNLDAGTLEFFKNNVSQGVAFTGLSGTFTPAIGDNTVSAATFNFGQRPFAYTAPSGFKALRDYNRQLVPTGGVIRGNYATLNDLAPSKPTLLNGALQTNAGNLGGINTFGMTTGKWFCEMEVVAVGAESSIGVSKGGTMSTYVGASADSWGYYSTGSKYTNGSSTTYGSSYTTGDTIGCAFDADLGLLSFYKNGVYQGIAFSGLTSGPYFFAMSGRTSTSANNVYINFGQRPWVYGPPAGFKPVCSTSIPQPTIQKASSYVDVVTYTGNGSTQTISGLGFSPDLVWGKSRSAANWHILIDSVRGSSKYLNSNRTDAEGTDSTIISSLDSNGFTLGSNATINGNSNTNVAWAWDENPIAGMDIVSYTGNGTTQNIAHSLGVAPKMIIVKSRSAVSDWVVGHASLDTSSPWGYYIFLSSDAARNNVGAINSWGNNSVVVPPTSSVFTIGSGGNLNSNLATYIAYLFAEVEGFSKFGSYTGNGATDGTFVFTGFRPAFVLIKGSTFISNWFINDNKRPGRNVTTLSALRPNLSGSEVATADYDTDFLSNGFKLRTATGDANSSGATFIFAAFAESPFKYARAR